MTDRERKRLTRIMLELFKTRQESKSDAVADELATAINALNRLLKA
jgi:hypothetical protein